MSPIKTRSLSAATVLKYVFGILLAFLVLSYVIFQARFFIAGPQVVLTGELSIIQNERSVTLEGNAQNITEITLNGRTISTDESGTFQESVVLENGYTIVSIQAKDRYGRETVLEREFVYAPLSLLN